MNHSHSRLLFSCLSALSLLATGCAGFNGAAFPNVPATSGSIGTISGSVYGGHAPLAGAHIYVLEGNMTAYGGLATSLLSGSGTTTTIEDRNIPTTGPGTPWYYIAADENGAFALTGKYSCTEGDLVYVYAYGGSATYPSGTNTFNVGGANSTAGTATETYVSGGSLTTGAATVTAAGNGYRTNHTTTDVAGTGGGGSGATATLVTNGAGAVTSINITAGGSGYTSLPAFVPDQPGFGGGGSGFAYSATISSLVDTVQFTVAATSASGVAGAPENFYVGEPITFTGLGSPLSTALTGSQSVIATNLTTTTFSVTVTGGTLGSGTGSVAVAAGATVTAAPAFNPGIVNLAVLGVCPSSGSFAAGGTLPSGATFAPIQYVYMNEVSTVAAAYALEGFADATADDMLHIGTSTTNAIGLQNAANVAGQLYDIQGKYLTTTYAGEGHIASPNTTNGNGIVPQSTLDTLGNILAACVDSHNIAGTPSPQCTTLFTNATENGIPYGTTGSGVLPQDTATAALYIAKNPAGTSANTAAFMSNLYTLPTGNVPFTPHLTTQPNDFTIAIQYPQSLNPEAANAESISIDGSGNVWMNSAGLKNIFEMNPVGVVTYTSPAQTYSYGYVSVDPANNIWSGNNYATSSETKITTSGATPSITTFPVLSGGLYDAYETVTSSNGNVYIGATPPTGTGSQTQWQTNAITSTGAAVANFPATLGLGANYKIAHGAIENVSSGGSGDIWWTTETNYGITRFNPTTGTVATGFPVTNMTGAPEMPGIDATGNLWVALQQANVVEKVSPAGVVTTLAGGTVTTPFGVTVDGSGSAFVAQRGGTSIIEYNNAGTAISPATNYTLAGQISKPLNLAADQSGNIWITAYDSNQIVQWVGAATPLTNPLSYASGQNKIGAKP